MPSYLLPPGVRFKDYLFTEPVELAGWRPTGCAGIVAILARNPQWGPKPLQPLYFGEACSLPANARGGNLLVSVLPMPYSTASQRRALCQELSAAYDPGSVTELSRKVDVLEARQQEQSQQILSLLTYIGKLFEPQTTGPRKPIGFLAQLSPAETTESGS